MSSAFRRPEAQIVVLGAMLAATGCRGSPGNASPAPKPSAVPAALEQATPSAPVAVSGSAASGAPAVLDLSGGLRPVGDPGTVDVMFDIHADGATRTISSLIYGINFDLHDAAQQRWGVVRSGGNRLTAYNWENNASNAGSDYLFQNDSGMSESDQPGQALFGLIDGAAAIAAPIIITIPNVDYVAADKNGGGDVRGSGPKYLSTRFRRNYPRKPTPFTALPDPEDDAVYQDEFVAFLKARRPQSKFIFSMDNEPELWSHTHAEVYPNPVTYEDLWRRNHDFAKAVKGVYPSAEVLGFASYGYAGFVSLQNAPDGGGRNFIAWYLEQAKAAEKVDGMRVIDYLDVHWYPEAQGGGKRIVGEDTEPAVVAAREQAPRSLWDRKYNETSWVRDAAGGPIALLPWLRAKIDVHYPGTKLAITEWNYGAGNHISGAVAVADVLGIFGREGVNLATYWPMLQDESFAHAAFRVFRNYDGVGGRFGDTSISANSSDAATASVYASFDSADPSRTFIVAINKATTIKTAGIKLTHSHIYSKARPFVLSAAQPALAALPEFGSESLNAFRYDMPAQSVSMIALLP